MNDNYVKILFWHDSFEEMSVESAWAKKEGDYYVLDNILFYAKGYAVGDLISVKKEEGELYGAELIKESGNSTIRVLVDSVESVGDLRNELIKFECQSEVSNFERLISVNIPSVVPYLKVKAFLDEGELNGIWEYQEACISDHHKKNMN